MATKLDYTIESPQERLKLVEQILAEVENPTPQYLEALADYMVLCMEKEEKRQHRLLTENRMATINKRETSYEGLVGQFENGEDGVSNLIVENNKNTIFQPKVQITKQDLEEIPFLRQLREGIERWEGFQKHASGREAYVIKRTLIEMRKDQYIIKNAYRQPINFSIVNHGGKFPIQIPSAEWIDPETKGVRYRGISLCDFRVCSAILCNYQKIKQACWERTQTDLWALMQDFDDLLEVLRDYPMYERIVEYKTNFLSNEEIKASLEEEFGFTHSVEYISSLWRNKIPKLMAQKAQDDFLMWYYMYQEKGKWKRCSRCGQVKLAHQRYFSVNNTSKDGWYSICKECRNAKNRKKAD